MTDANCDDFFASWLLARENGEERDIESLAAEHPECSDALRAQHAVLLRLESVLGLSSPPTEAAAGSDPDAPPDPGLLLEPPQSGETETKPAPLLERLTQRGPPRGRFVVKERIGRGGMGAVFRVYDSEIGRHVAAKVLHLDDPAYLSRFLEEAQITGQLDHPAFIPVHDFALDEKGRIFFTMKLVKGITDEQTEEIRAETLSDVIEKIHAGIEDWTLTRGLDVILRVAEAMEFAHVKGVVHRDLKPANILVGRYGEVYVTDFGIARVQGTPHLATHGYRSEAFTAESSDPGATSPTSLTLVRTERRDAIELGGGHPPTTASPDSPGPTQEGSTIGTPAYMPPEQARGSLGEINARSDVYSLGTTLYHLIAGAAPWHTHDRYPEPFEIVRSLARGDRPKPLQHVAPDSPAELLAIVDKAMAADPKKRYESMKTLAADLRAYLEQRVVSAYKTGALAELKKWVQRNPALAAAAGLLILVLASATSIVLKKNVEISAQKATVEARTAEFDQLAGKVHLEQALDREQDLYPPWPEKIEAMERWLAEDAQRLLDLKPTLESTLESLRARALPWTTAQRESDRATHPRLPELESLRDPAHWMRNVMISDTNSNRPRDPPSLPANLSTASAAELEAFAWQRVDRDPTKRLFGEDEIALAAAKRAVEILEADDAPSELASALDTQAWAYFVNGRPEEAIAASNRSIAAAPAEQREYYAAFNRTLVNAIATHTGEAGAALLADIERRISALESLVADRRSFDFESGSDSFLHSTLSELNIGISSFESNEIEAVRRRLDWARRIESLTLRHPNARMTWEDARTAISKADDVVASKRYASSPGGPIDLKPQMGLVPIGMNPVTKLWEFYDLGTACDLTAREDPAQITIPTHRDDGTITVFDQTGVVFVLLPGGSFAQGAQNVSEDDANFDPSAGEDESVFGSAVIVTVGPFFIARHELTQGQWVRIANENPSRWASEYALITELNRPVDNVSWFDCRGWAERAGMTLPTEAQWEYACRAQSVTPFSFGSRAADIVGYGNIQDLSFAKLFPNADPDAREPWDDGQGIPSVVGTFAPNDFGLFDVHGNVWEWCEDGYGSLETPARTPDGLREPKGASMRVSRGGSFGARATDARSARRSRDPPNTMDGYLGVRPARALAGHEPH